MQEMIDDDRQAEQARDGVEEGAVSIEVLRRSRFLLRVSRPILLLHGRQSSAAGTPALIVRSDVN